MNNDKNIRSTTGNKDALDLLENIRKKVEEDFDIDKVVRQNIDFYHSLIITNWL